MADEWGPLAGLAGTWEGNDGVDLSYHHAEKEVGETRYFERATFGTFGPVDNGTQSLYGLDYRMAAWRHGEEDGDPFHTEVGYWLWDADRREVMRCFMVPRGVTVLAGGTCDPEASEFTMKADCDSSGCGILSNNYLLDASKSLTYEVTVKIDGDTCTYASDTVLDMAQFDEPYHHTDANTLRRVSD